MKASLYHLERNKNSKLGHLISKSFNPKDGGMADWQLNFMRKSMKHIEKLGSSKRILKRKGTKKYGYQNMTTSLLNIDQGSGEGSNNSIERKIVGKGRNRTYNIPSQNTSLSRMGTLNDVRSSSQNISPHRANRNMYKVKGKRERKKNKSMTIQELGELCNKAGKNTISEKESKQVKGFRQAWENRMNNDGVTSIMNSEKLIKIHEELYTDSSKSEKSDDGSTSSKIEKMDLKNRNVVSKIKSGGTKFFSKIKK